MILLFTLSNAKVWLQIPSIKLWGDDDVVGDVDDDNEDEEEEYTMMTITTMIMVLVLIIMRVMIMIQRR